MLNTRPPFRVNPVALLSVPVPPAASMVLPVPFIVPPLHVRLLLIFTAPVPCSVPQEKFNVPIVDSVVPLKLTVAPLILTGRVAVTGVFSTTAPLVYLAAPVPARPRLLAERLVPPLNMMSPAEVKERLSSLEIVPETVMVLVAGPVVVMLLDWVPAGVMSVVGPIVNGALLVN